MALTEKIRADLTESMKARDAERTSTLRMLQAALKNEQIDKGHELGDAEAVAVIRRAVKQRQDSIEQYEKGNRQDLADKEKREMEILNVYLPQQMADHEVEKLIQDVIQLTGAESRKDVGRVMKEIMAKYRDQLDGRKVQEVLARLLP
jgi:uncharacterized protein YqeY